jgi:hypothetical protein
MTNNVQTTPITEPVETNVGDANELDILNTPPETVDTPPATNEEDSSERVVPDENSVEYWKSRSLNAEKILNEEAANSAVDKTPPEDYTKPVSLSNQDFIGDMDISELSTNKEKFNEVLNKMRITTYNEAVTEVVKKLPHIINLITSKHIQANNDMQTFLSTNPDIVSNKNYFVKIVNEVQGKNPELNHAQLLTKSAEEFRLRLKTSVKQAEPTPAQIKPTQSPRPSAVPTSNNIDDEIRELLG